MPGLTCDERDVLKTTLAHHGVTDEKLDEHLETFAAWIREADRAKFNPHQPQTQFPLVLLILMGIHEKDERM